MNELSVYLRFVDDEVMAEEISKILELDAAKAYAKGGLIPSKNNSKPRYYKCNGWHFSSGVDKKESDIEIHLDALWEKLDYAMDKFELLPDINGKYLQCVCYTHDRPYIGLRHKDIEYMHKMGLEFDYDIYTLENEE